jgi:sugar lactone lactonase YvrE
MTAFRLHETIPVQNVLGECILWDDGRQSLWWTDIQAARLYRYAFGSSALQHHALPERLCSFGFIENDRRLICAFASGFACFDPETDELDWIFRPAFDAAGTRFNDGRVDRRGRFWAGTMLESDSDGEGEDEGEGAHAGEGAARDGPAEPQSGGLYRLTGTDCVRMLDGIAISNSLCFSPHGETLYFADSPTRNIRAFELDTETGQLGASRTFATVEGAGVPDGSTIDADGCLWNAEWGNARVVRYAPDGARQAVLELPVTQPTCVCFAGPELDRLVVTTARDGLSREALGTEPLAGDVLIYETPFRGLRESRFRLAPRAAVAG